MRNILLVLDDWETAEASARYAVQLAQHRRADLQVLVCIRDPLLELQRYVGVDNFGDMRQQLQQQAEERTQELLEPYGDAAGATVPEVCWSATPHREILAAARRCEADLVIKHATYHSPLSEFIRTPDDWQLLRQAEWPVLMLGADPKPPAFVLAAVDSLDDRPDHQRLSARVFDQGHAMARGFGVPFKVVTVSPDPGLSYSLAGALPTYVETTRGLAAQARQQLEELIQRFGVVCDEVLVLRGMADRQLAAAMSGNGMLVIGGCSNRGLKGRLLGNVAERVLHYVDGNILVVP